MENKRARLNILSTQLNQAARIEAAWHSSDQSEVEHKRKLLAEVWDELDDLQIHIGHELYYQVESMRLVVLKHTATLDAAQFAKWTAELRNEIISARGEASLLGIRLFSAKSRIFERIYRWQEEQDDKRSS